MLNERPTPPARPRSTEGPVPKGLVCVRCGYDLRGLERDGRCPECGTAVEETLERAGPVVSADGIAEGDVVVDGCRLHAASLIALAPLFALAPAVSTCGQIAIALAGCFAAAQFFVVRDWRRGLAPLAADDPDLRDRLDAARTTTKLFATPICAAAVFVLLPCCVGGSVTGMVGVLLTALVVCCAMPLLVVLRRLVVRIAFKAMPAAEASTARVLGPVHEWWLAGAGIAAGFAWTTVAVLMLADRTRRAGLVPGAGAGGGGSIESILIAAIAIGLVALVVAGIAVLRYGLFVAALASIVPQHPRFNPAANRVALAARRSRRAAAADPDPDVLGMPTADPPRSPQPGRSSGDDEPIPLAPLDPLDPDDEPRSGEQQGPQRGPRRPTR
jgi:hypothetical protein